MSAHTREPGERRRRGRPRLAPEAQRKRLLEGALRAFRDRAYESTTVADIVREAGMSSRSFYEHFDSKEDLVVELVNQAGAELVGEIERAVAETEDMSQLLSRGMRAYLEAFANTPVDLSHLGDRAPLRVFAARRRYALEIAALAEREARRAWERGAIEREPDPLAVEMVVCGLDALAWRYVTEGRGHELLPLHPRLRDLVARIWFGESAVGGAGPAQPGAGEDENAAG